MVNSCFEEDNKCEIQSNKVIDFPVANNQAIHRKRHRRMHGFFN